MNKHLRLKLILVSGFLLQLVVCIFIVPFGVLLFLASRGGFTLGPGSLDWTASVSKDVQIWRPNSSGLRVLGAVEIGPQIVEANYDDSYLIAKQRVAVDNYDSYWIADLRVNKLEGPYTEETFRRECALLGITLQLRDVYDFKPEVE